METVYFNWSDYFVFFMMLLVSVLIGVYFGCFGSKQATVDEYLLAGKNMKAIPVGLSLVASSISGVTLIGVPAEVYTDGPTFWVIVPAFLMACIFTNYMVLPIFLELKIISVYEYLELRFDRSVRKLTSAFYNASYLLFLPSVIYVPSLCLSQVTGTNLHIITVGVTFVCVFYTMIGGLKAVVWTDFFQTTVTVFACFLIVIVGTSKAGGISNVLNVAYQNGKLNIFDMDINPFKRSTFWTILIGNFIMNILATGTGQANVQRFKSLKSQKDIPFVLFIYWFGVGFFTTISVYGGILIYVTYFGCDPIERKFVDKPDQIFPYYVLQYTGHIPTLPGFFIAGVFSVALSSLSTGLNTIAGTIYEDYIKKPGYDEKRANVIMKCIVFAVGVFSILFVFLIEKMGKILSVSFIITSVTYSPVCILFCLGIFFPWANAKGAISGALSASITLCWIAIGASVSKVNFATKRVYPVDTCDNTNITIIENTMGNFTDVTDNNEADEIFILYKLSYMLYILLGVIVGVTVGLTVSFITGSTDLTKLDPNLISPGLRRFLPKSTNSSEEQIEKIILEDSNSPKILGITKND